MASSEAKLSTTGLADSATDSVLCDDELLVDELGPKNISAYCQDSSLSEEVAAILRYLVGVAKIDQAKNGSVYLHVVFGVHYLEFNSTEFILSGQ